MAFTFDGMITTAPVGEWHRAFEIPFGPVYAIPLTGDLFDELVPGGWSRPPRDGFSHLAPELETAIAALSRRTPIGYVEISCFGGPCDRAALFWRSGEIVFGPEVTEDGSEPAPEPNAFNTVLRGLGVEARDGLDEFDTIGFGRWRSTRLQYQGRSVPRYGHELPNGVDRGLWVRTTSGGKGPDGFGYLCELDGAEFGTFGVWYPRRGLVESSHLDDIERASEASHTWIRGYLAGQRSSRPE